MEKQMQNASKNTRARQDNKDKNSLPKMDFTNQTWEEENFCQAFSDQKDQQISKKHRQNNTEKHKAATRQQEQKFAPEKGSQKPSLRRREFLSSIFGNKKPNKYAKT